MRKSVVETPEIVDDCRIGPLVLAFPGDPNELKYELRWAKTTKKNDKKIKDSEETSGQALSWLARKEIIGQTKVLQLNIPKN